MGVVNAVGSQAMNTNRPDASTIKEVVAPGNTLEIPELKSQPTANEKIECIAQALNRYLVSIQRDLEIHIHKGTEQLMVKVISKGDGKVIREVPSEELLNLVARIDEVTGALFDGKV